MKALILAAGIGSRLAPLTNHCPKALVTVSGQPIIMNQIKCLKENGIDDIVIISGYKSDVLKKTVSEQYPHVTFLENKNYENTNNMYSAYLAKGCLYGEAFLMMNADVFFDPNVISSLLTFKAEAAIVTDKGNYLAESMKVSGEYGKLTKISKMISQEEALGVSIDVYKLSEKVGKALFDKCKEYIEEKKELNLWSEVALNDILSSYEVLPCPLNGRWIEIDTAEDLKEAERLFSYD